MRCAGFYLFPTSRKDPIDHGLDHLDAVMGCCAGSYLFSTRWTDQTDHDLL